MLSTKQDIITQLQKDILPLQGFKPPPAGMAVDVGLGPIAAAFPNGPFPTGAVHELLSAGAEQAAAAGGFDRARDRKKNRPFRRKALLPLAPHEPV